VARPISRNKNTFLADIRAKTVNDGKVSTREAKALVSGWNRALTPEQADLLKTAVNNTRGTFEPGAARRIESFVNQVLPRLVIGGSAPGTAKLSWTPPTQNADGSPLLNLAGYEVRWGRTPDATEFSSAISDPRATTFDINGLGTGTWYFKMASKNTAGEMSVFTPPVSKTIQ
jgi:hypothetical protein